MWPRSMGTVATRARRAWRLGHLRPRRPSAARSASRSGTPWPCRALARSATAALAGTARSRRASRFMAGRVAPRAVHCCAWTSTPWRAASSSLGAPNMCLRSGGRGSTARRSRCRCSSCTATARTAPPRTGGGGGGSAARQSSRGLATLRPPRRVRRPSAFVALRSRRSLRGPASSGCWRTRIRRGCPARTGALTTTGSSRGSCDARW
mmetsp:Transcript_27314/g.78656  ORF Transcript_27314/g.78656 Transcript_27314/m.78656 type:complete len:208 (-) Transcript_27314:369-992(-)